MMLSSYTEHNKATRLFNGYPKYVFGESFGFPIRFAAII